MRYKIDAGFLKMAVHENKRRKKSANPRRTVTKFAENDIRKESLYPVFKKCLIIA